MGWFKKSAREAKPLVQHQEKTANKIAEKILALQTSTAAKLNSKAQKMGKTRVIFLLVALLIGFTAYLVYIMVNALF